MKKLLMVLMGVMVLAGGGSADTFMFNFDFGGPEHLYEGDAVFVSSHLPGDVGYWNPNGGPPEADFSLSTGEVTEMRAFPGEMNVVTDPDNPNLILRNGRQTPEGAGHTYVTSPNTPMWLVVYSGGDGTDYYKTEITVNTNTEAGTVTVTSSGTNSPVFIEGENYWIFEVVSLGWGGIPISIAPAPGAEMAVLSGMQLTNAEPVTAAPALAFDNVITTLDLLPAALAATVTGNSDDITSVDFEVVSAPEGVELENVVLIDTTVDNQNPTATLDVVTDGLYEVRLSVSDGITDVEGIASVQIFADPCDAAQAAPGYAKNPMDLNDDCLVNLADLAIFADQWLYDSSMKAQVTYLEASEKPDDYLSERPAWAGFWLNVFGAEPTQEQLGDLAGALTGLTNKPKWKDMERADGDYSNMYNVIGKRIEDAYNNDEYYYCELWLGHLGVPDWIFSAPHNVPEPIAGYPDYTDPTYLSLSERFYNELAAYIASLPQGWIDRIAFIQPGFGSTGDRQLYKANNDYISSDDYLSVMQTQTNAFISAFQSHPETQNIRFLWNIDNYDGTDPSQLNGFTGQRRGEMLYAEWLRNETGQGQLRKQQFTIAIGYQVPNELFQDNEQRDDFFGTSGRWGGNPEFIRGEFNDQKFNELPLGLVNPGLNYYWTAISSVDRGLDAWEGKLNHWNFLGENFPSHKPAMVEAAAFSSRYSYRKDPATSPYAFIALRDGLDYNDDRFSDFGTSDSQKVSAILAEFDPYGAKNDDNDSALNRVGNRYLENATGLNDCVKNIISRNYSRFITQIDANTTSAGYWRVGLNDQGEGHHYGRFARGFDVDKGKNTMYFDVADEFFEANRAEDGDKTLKIKVIYYASDEGSWELKYHAQDGTMKTALSVTNSGSGWQTAEVTVNDALLDNGDPIKGADLVLKNTGGTNCRFHMIELERNPDGKMIEVH